MRIKSLLCQDMMFQRKYGFYVTYLILVILYICILSAIPGSAKEDAAILMILTDPATMGLFFMGAIVLLEKSQRVLNSIAVSPVQPKEYVIAKAGSIAVISLIAGVLLALSAGQYQLFGIITGTLFGAMIYTMIGLCIAMKVKSLNTFVVATVPVEIISFVPAVIYQFFYQKQWMLLHPMCAMIELYKNGENIWIALLSLILWSVLFLNLAARCVTKSMKSIGGVKL